MRLLKNTVYVKGFNIYSLLNRYKKEIGGDIPESVQMIVCQEYLKQPLGKIDNEWTYFKRVVGDVYERYNAERNEREGKLYKKTRMPESLKQIFAKLGGRE